MTADSIIAVLKTGQDICPELQFAKPTATALEKIGEFFILKFNKGEYPAIDMIAYYLLTPDCQKEVSGLEIPGFSLPADKASWLIGATPKMCKELSKIIELCYQAGGHPIPALKFLKKNRPRRLFNIGIRPI